MFYYIIFQTLHLLQLYNNSLKHAKIVGTTTLNVRKWNIFRSKFALFCVLQFSSVFSACSIILNFDWFWVSGREYIENLHRKRNRIWRQQLRPGVKADVAILHIQEPFWFKAYMQGRHLRKPHFPIRLLLS